MHRIWTENLRYRWSRRRHARAPVTTTVRRDLIPKRFSDIQRVADELRSRFIYTRDGIDRLWDSIDTPASCWERAFPGPLRDDCDGFHAALYWAVSHNFRCYLLTLVTRQIVDSHVLLYIRHGGHFYLDYTYLSDRFMTFDSMVEHIGRRREMDIVSTELSVFTNGWRKGG